MKKILFVSYNHHSNKADAIQNRRLIRGLGTSYDITILCKDEHFSEQESVISVDSKNLYFLDRVLYKICPFLRPCFSFNYNAWARKAYNCVRDEINNYDYVFITMEPYPLVSFIRLLEKNYKGKIVTFIYDPCVENLFFPQGNIAISFRRKLESELCNKSSIVIVNNDLVYKQCTHRNPNSAIYQIPLCTEKIVYSKCKKTENKPLKIVHAGNIHGARRLNELNDTVSILKKKYDNLSSKLNIFMYGDCNVLQKTLVINSKNDDVINFMGFVDADCINKELSDADSLLLIDPIEGSNYSFPSKLCEYMQYGKMILAFTSKKSVSRKILQESGNICCGKGEAAIMADFLIMSIDNRSLLSVPSNRVFSEQYTIENVCSKIQEVLENGTI